MKHEAATIWNFVALQVSDIVHANPWLSGRLRKGFDCDWAKLSFEQLSGSERWDRLDGKSWWIIGWIMVDPADRIDLLFSLLFNSHGWYYMIPSREINISHLGKRKIIFKMPFFGGYVSFLEGTIFCCSFCCGGSSGPFLAIPKVLTEDHFVVTGCKSWVGETILIKYQRRHELQIWSIGIHTWDVYIDMSIHMPKMTAIVLAFSPLLLSLLSISYDQAQ